MIIHLYKEFGNNLIIRSSVAFLFKKINTLEKNDIIIDFKNINFISRSCAAEYIKQREITHKNIMEKNLSKEVKSMFNVVVKQLKSINFNFTKSAILAE